MSEFKASASSHTSRTNNSNTSRKRYCQRCIQSSQKESSDKAVFSTSRELYLHLRENHCTKEGGSFVCLYGPNDVCPSLPVDGVSENDYQDHVWKDHILLDKMDYKRNSMLLNEDSPVDEPSIVKDQHKWTVYMSQVNLPAVLNDPRLTRRETDFFTKTWGEGFEKTTIPPSPYIPVVTHDQFKNFLVKTNARNKNKKKNKGSTDGALQKKNIEMTFKTEEFDVIPKIFFSPNFSLLDLETFNSVLPWSSIDSSQQQQPPQQPQQPQQQRQQQQPSPHFQQSLQQKQQMQQKQQQQPQHRSSKLLQEKLSHYLDLIEVQITKQISCRSDAFFDAMVSQNNLQGHLQNTCRSVHFLRERVKHLEEVMVRQPLQVIHQSATRFKYQLILEKLKLMSTIQQTQPTLQLLLTTSDFLGALDLISTTQEVLAQELAGLHCFRHLGSQLHEMEKLVVRMIEEEFVSFVTGYFNQPVNQSNSDDLVAIYSKPRPVVLIDSCPAMDVEKLVLIALGICRHHKINFLDVLDLESTTTIRTVIKQTVIEAVAMTEVYESDNKLASQMRLLKYDQWIVMLKKLFINLVVMLQRVWLVTNVFRSIAMALVEKTPNIVGNIIDSRPSNDQQMLKDNSTKDSFFNDVDVDVVAMMTITAAPFGNNYFDDFRVDPTDDISVLHESTTTTTTTSTTSTTTATTSSSTTSTTSKATNYVDTTTTDNKPPPTTTTTTMMTNENDSINDITNDNNNDITNTDNSNNNNLNNTSSNSNNDNDDDYVVANGDGGDEDDDDDEVTATIKKEIVMMLKDCDPILSEGESLKMGCALKELLCKVCEHAHDRCFKLFNARAKDGFLDRLSTLEFLELSKCVEWFVGQTHRICNRRSTTLRGHLQSQVLKFVNKFHEDKKNKLCLILDKERWKQVDVPTEFQELVDHISNSGELKLPPKKMDPDNRSADHLMVGGEKYVLVGTALILLKMVVEYCDFASELPSAYADVLSRLIELLKTFNSRTCQLILGAGALHLVGLKTINAKNLALASRCLQLFVHYLPMVKEFFSSRLADKQMSMIKRVDHLIKDYNNHIVEISMKLVSIMDAAILNAVSKYEIRPSSSASSSASSSPSPTFENIVKQMSRFHEAISDLLPSNQIQSIINQFHSNFVMNLRRQLANSNFNKEDQMSRSYLDCDLRHYTKTIKNLVGFETFPFAINDVIGD